MKDPIPFRKLDQPVRPSRGRSGLALLLALALWPSLLAAAPQTITPALGSLPDRFVNAAPFAVAATASSGLSVVYSIVDAAPVASIHPVTGLITLDGLPGTVTVQYDQPGDGGGLWDPAPPVQQTFQVTKVPQSLTILPIPDKLTTAGFLDLDSYFSASSGLPAQVTVLEGNLTVVTLDPINNILDFTGNPGRVRLQVTQPGDATYAAAPAVPVVEFRVQQTQFVSLSVDSTQQFGSQPFPVYAVASSGLPVTLSIVCNPADLATLVGTTIVLKNDFNSTSVGTITVTATQAGNDEWIFDSASTTVTVEQADQTIEFDEITVPTYLGPAVRLTARSLLEVDFVDVPSVLPVTFTLEDANSNLRATLVDEAYPGEAVDHLNELLVPDGGAGSVTVTARQAGNANVRPALAVTRAVSVARSTQYVRFDQPIADITFGEYPFTVSATSYRPDGSTNGGAISYSIYNGPAYIRSPNTVVTTGPGQVIVQAFQGGEVDDNGDGEPDFEPALVQEAYVSRTINTTTGALFLDQWTWRNPIPAGDFYQSILFAGGQFVAVGDGGQVVTSPSGADGDWTVQPAGITTDLQGIAYDGSRYIAVGSGGEVWSSPTALGAWTQQEAALGGGADLQDVTFAGGQFVAVGEGGVIFTSPTGLNATWSQPVSGSTEDLLSITSHGGQYVVVGTQGTILTSLDGVAWTVQVSGTVQDLNDVYWDSTRDLLIVVGEGGIVLTSTDGAYWAVRNSSTTLDLHAVSSGNEVLVAVGDHGKVLTSRDGVVWTERSTRYLNSFHDITFALGFYIGVGDCFSVFSSPTGEAWSILESCRPESFRNVAYDSGEFVTVGENGAVLTSPDGVVWTNRRADLPLAAQTVDWRGVSAGPAVGKDFVLVGAGGAVLRYDGVSFTAATTVPAGISRLNDITVGEGRYVAVGDGFTIITSTDGNDWSTVPVTFGASHPLRGIVYAEAIDTWVAVGDRGTILLSPDGINWSFRYSGNARDLYDVAYGIEAGGFVAVGAEGTVLNSEFGDVWTSRISGTIYTIRSVAYQQDRSPGTGGTFVAVGANFQVLSSRDALTWTVQISGNLNDLRGVGHGNGLFVAVGDHQAILTTTSALPSGLDLWSYQNPLPDGTALNRIIFENNTYVAVGDDGVILVSTDGYNWEQQDSGTTDDIRCVTFGNDRFVAVGGQAILTSTDARVWTTQRTWHAPLNAVAYLNGIFVAVGDSGLIVRSSNGLDWSLSGGLPGTAPNFYDVTYGDGYFIAVGSVSVVNLYCAGDFKDFPMTTVALSTDGIVWNQMYPVITGFTPEGCPIFMQTTLRGVKYGNGVFLAVGDSFTVLKWDRSFTTPFVLRGDTASVTSDWSRRIVGGGTLRAVAFGDANGTPRFTIVGEGGIVMTSLNGDDFELRYPGITENLHGAAFGKETFLAVGANGRILNSPDGSNWQALRSSAFLQTIADTAYNGELLVTVADQGRILTSNDGRSWTLRESGTSLDFNAVAYGNGRFVAVTDSGWSVTSSDGIIWTPNFSGANADLLAVAYHESGDAIPTRTFIAVGRNGIILTSDNGVTWSVRTSGTLSHLNGVAHGAGLYVAVGARGAIQTSSDGTLWSAAPGIPPGFVIDLQGVAFGNGIFTAVGRFGQILTSPDGLNWTTRSSGTSYPIEDIYFGDGLFVASGLEGTVLTSVDGITWRRRPTNTRANLVGGSFADGLYVNVGEYGTIITSGELIIKQNQAIFFPPIDNRAVGDPAFTLSATASSGLPVSYSIVTGGHIARIPPGGNVVYLESGQDGAVTVRASQAGNRQYKAAPDVDRSFLVQISNQTIVFDPIADKVFGDPPFAAVATAVDGLAVPNGLSVQFRVINGPASVNGNLVTIAGAGAVELEAYNVGNASFSPASARRTFNVAKANQTITFNPVSEKSFGDPPFLLSATASSGLPVKFTILQGPATVDASGLLTMTGAGTVQVSASQAGDANFNAAPDVDQSFTIQTAPPGNAWTAADLPIFNAPDSLLGVDWANDRFLAYGQDFRLLSAPDGLDWTLLTTGVTASSGIAYGNGVYVAVGQGGSLLTSTDGTNWVIGDSGFEVNLNSVSYGNGRFVVVGDAGFIATSLDGRSWTTVTLAPAIEESLLDVAFGHGRFVAVGSAGLILSSVDAANWTRFTHQLGTDLNAVTYGNGQYVAVGENFTIWTSADALTWFVRTSGSVSLKDVTYGNNRFVTVGNSGAIFTSPDGISWTSRSSGTPNDLTGAAFADTIFVVVGAGGTILTSGELITKSPQTINFDAIPDKAFGAAPFALTQPVSSAGLDVRFTVLAGPAAIDPATKQVSLTGAGAVTILAAQDGNVNYYPATPVIRTFHVAKGDQTIVFATDPVDVGLTAFGIPPIDLYGLDTDPLNDLIFAPQVLDAATLLPTNLPLTYRVVSGPASLRVEQVEDVDVTYLVINSEGLVEVAVEQAGSANYNLANRSFGLVISGRYPTGQVQMPQDEQIFTTVSSIYLQAAAIDTGANAGIAAVEFFANGAKIGNGTQIAGTHYWYFDNWVPGIWGTYSITVHVTDVDGYTSYNADPVVIAVEPSGSAAPTVTLTNPGAVTLGQNVALTANASDADGTIAQVQFLINGAILTTDTTAPFSANWQPDRVGTYLVQAIATDNTGNTDVSTPIVIPVTATSPVGFPPSVSLLSPLGGAFTSSSRLQLWAGASDVDGTVSTVDFYANGALVGSDATAPFVAAWTPGQAGTYQLTAIARDNQNNATVSAPLAVTITSASSAPPTVTLADPADYVLGASTFLNATATDPDGIVSLAQFTLNGQNLGESFTPAGASFSRLWAAASPGQYVIGLRVTDNSGNVVEATPVVVVVTQSPPFSVAFTNPVVGSLNPADDTYIPLGSDILVEAQAAGVSGAVQSMEFYVNNELVGTDSAAPYTVIWSPKSLGNHRLLVIARDTSGTVATDEIVANVQPRIGRLPTLSVAITADGNLTENSEVMVTATVADEDPDIEVEFYLNGEPVEARPESPLAVRMQPVALSDDKDSPQYRNYEIRVFARDVDGNTRAVVLDTIYSADLFINTPQVSLLTPKAGDAVTAGLPVTLRADVSGSGADDVQKVIFYANGVEIGSDAGAPYTLEWTPFLQLAENNKPVVLTAAVLRNARSWDSDPAELEDDFINVTPVGLSADVIVTITKNNQGASPTVALLEPANASKYVRGTLLDITAAADDTDGTIAKVEIFANGILLGLLEEAPYQTTWQPSAPGNYVLHAVATDNLGNTTASANVAVEIRAPVGTPPTVVVTNPAADSTVTTASRVLFAVGASDIDGTISSVSFLANGVLVGTDTTFPFSLNWQPGVAGTYRLVAEATDNSNNVVRSTAVALTVNAASSQVPTVSLGALAASAVKGSPVLLQATASDPDGVLAQVEFFANGVSLGVDGTSPYRLTWTPAEVGTFNLLAVATDNTGNTAVSEVRTVTVTTGSAPTVSVSAPATGSTYRIGQTVDLAANANDPDGTVVSVEFLANGLSLAAPVTTQPFTLAWTPSVTGAYAVTAVAIDSSGNVTTSAAITVNIAESVGAAPTVSLASPANNSARVVGTTGLIRANANDADGWVASVEFFANGLSLGEPDTTEPFEIDWTPAVSGTWRLTAVATDNLGNTGLSTTVTVTVGATAGTVPTVAIANPLAGAQVLAGRAVTIRVNANDTDGAVTQVEYFANGLSLGEADTQFPYEFTWTPANLGAITLTAAATDDSGNRVLSAPVGVTVVGTIGAAPTVSVDPLATAINNTVLVGRTHRLMATAADSDGVVTQVEFFAFGSSLGLDTTYPFAIDWAPVATGAYGITAVATDNDGNRTTSAVRTVTVAATIGTVPAVAISSPAAAATLMRGEPVMISANASDADGAITSLQFHIQGVPVGDLLTEEPFEFEWTPLIRGTYLLTAEAIDNAGNLVVSAPISVTVAEAVGQVPTVTIDQPLDGSTRVVGTTGRIQVTALDADGLITSVEFFANGLSLGAPDTAEPFEVTWTPAVRGAYKLTAVARDNSGNTATSAVHTITVGTTAGTAPTIALNPIPTASNGNVLVNQTHLLGASAGDADGLITQVEFFANGVSLGAADTVFPYELNWTPGNLGQVKIKAVATDDSGNQTTTAEQTLQVVAAIGSVPSVSITLPVNGTTRVVNTTINVWANATDSDGLITGVQFFANGTPISAIDTAEPFIVPWTPAVNGTYSLTAVATDDKGNRSTSTNSVVVTITTNVSPTAELLSPADASAFTLGSTIEIRADANDADGSVATLELLANDVLVQSFAAKPYTYLWTPTLAGNYTLKVVATDDVGNKTTSASRTVQVKAPVGDPPTVGIINPLDGSTHTTSSTLLILAGASDPDHASRQPAKVEFFVNGESKGDDGTYPYSLSWTPGSPGTYRLSAAATDQAGNVVTSTPVDITVTAAVSAGPVVSVQDPPATILKGSRVPLKAAASDSDGWVTQVQFRFNAVTAETVTSGTNVFTFDWEPDAIGDYLLTVLATDNSGNTAESQPVLIKVTAPVDLFAVALSKPVDGNPIRVNSDVLLEAVPTITSGTVESIEFRVNEQTIAVDSVEPYSVFWQPPAAQTFVVRVIARDGAGRTTETSKSIAVLPIVGQIPSLSVSVTADGNVTPGSRVVVGATVFDDDASVTTQFFLNGELINNTVTPAGDNAFVLTPEVLNQADNSYELRVIATDSNGNSRGVIQSPLYIHRISFNRPNIDILTPSGDDPLTLNVDETTEVVEGSRTTISARVRGSGATDVQRVLFYVNGEEIGEAVGEPYSLDWVAERRTTADVENVIITAAALRSTKLFDWDLDPDSEPVEVTPVQVASPITIRVKRDTDQSPPQSVVITTPENDQNLSAGEEIVIQAVATPSNGRSIAEVEFVVNGQTISRDFEAPYEATYTPFSPGTLTIKARATQNNSKSKESDPVVVNVIVGTLPEVTSFTSDATNNESLVGAPINFAVEATDENGIRMVELYRNDLLVGTDETAPYSFTNVPVTSGAFTYYADVRNVDGNIKRSDSITISVRYPDPLGNDRDYAYVSYNDMLFRAPSAEELGEVSDLLSLGGLPREQIILGLLDEPEYKAVRNALLARFFLTNVWPDRETLIKDLNVVNSRSLTGLVESLLSEFSSARLSGKALPPVTATELEKREILETLWEIKYGPLPVITVEQQNQLLRYYNLFGPTKFLAEFIRDVGIIGTSTRNLTPVLGIFYPPNDRTLLWADAATLYVNLHRVQPSVAQVEALALKTAADQVREILASSAYENRFAGATLLAIDLGGGWKWLGWLGYYYDSHAPWVYHADHGWLYLQAGTPASIWMATLDMGWLWTSDSYYPFLYRQSDRTWLWYQQGTANPRYFWHADGTVETR